MMSKLQRARGRHELRRRAEWGLQGQAKGIMLTLEDVKAYNLKMCSGVDGPKLYDEGNSDISTRINSQIYSEDSMATRQENESHISSLCVPVNSDIESHLSSFIEKRLVHKEDRLEQKALMNERLRLHLRHAKIFNFEFEPWDPDPTFTISSNWHQKKRVIKADYTELIETEQEDSSVDLMRDPMNTANAIEHLEHAESDMQSPAELVHKTTKSGWHGMFPFIIKLVLLMSARA